MAQSPTGTLPRVLPRILLRHEAILALLLVLALVVLGLNNDRFFTTANLLNQGRLMTEVGLIAVVMTFVIITGGIDLSVGSIVGLCGMVAGYLVLHGVDLGFAWTIQFNTFEIALITILVGVLIGLVNGLLITRLNVAPFIATLGTLYVARGAALLASGGATFPNLSGNADWGSDTFRWIGTGNILGIPVSIWLLIVVAVAAAYVARNTPLGRHIYAVGGNERGAGLSGVKVRQVKFAVYMFSGLCAALVGLIIASQHQAAHPATGETFELNAIAAAVLGGTSMSGGRGRIGGTIVGAFVIGILSDGLVMMGVSTFWQTVIKGLVIIAAVVVDQAQSRLEARVVLRQQAAAAR